MSEPVFIEPTDADLIKRAKRGDLDAFGLIYERYVETIFRYIRTRVEDDQAAEDLTEVVFLRSFEAIGKYREKGLRYSAYLYQVARNQLVDHYRRSDRTVSLESSEHLLVSSDGVDRELIHEEEAASLRSALERLPGEYQEIIRLRVLMEMPTVEAAEWMERSEGAVRVLLHRALKALKREVVQGNESGNRSAS